MVNWNRKESHTEISDLVLGGIAVPVEEETGHKVGWIEVRDIEEEEKEKRLWIARQNSSLVIPALKKKKEEEERRLEKWTVQK